MLISGSRSRSIGFQSNARDRPTGGFRRSRTASNGRPKLTAKDLQPFKVHGKTEAPPAEFVGLLPGNDVEMRMRDILPGGNTVGKRQRDPFVIRKNRSQTSRDLLSFTHQILDLGRSEIRERRDMPPRNHERVPRVHRTNVHERDRKPALNDRHRWEFTGDDAAKHARGVAHGAGIVISKKPLLQCEDLALAK